MPRTLAEVNADIEAAHAIYNNKLAAASQAYNEALQTAKAEAEADLKTLYEERKRLSEQG